MSSKAKWIIAGIVVAMVWLAYTGIKQWVSTDRLEPGEPVLTIKNESGDPALVRVVGPTAEDIEMPSFGKKAINIDDGDYYLKIRYGTDDSDYTYKKSKPFTVTKTDTGYSG